MSLYLRSRRTVLTPATDWRSGYKLIKVSIEMRVKKKLCFQAENCKIELTREITREDQNCWNWFKNHVYSPWSADSPVESYSAYVPEIFGITISKRTKRMKTGIGFWLNVNLKSLIPVGDSVPDTRVNLERLGIGTR